MPLLEPAHKFILGVTVPPIDGGSTVIVPTVEIAVPQLPLVTFTLYRVVSVKPAYACDAVVLFGIIVVHVVPLSIEESHDEIFPISPLNVSVPLLVVLQTIVDPARTPPTVTGLIVTV